MIVFSVDFAWIRKMVTNRTEFQSFADIVCVDIKYKVLFMTWFNIFFYKWISYMILNLRFLLYNIYRRETTGVHIYSSNRRIVLSRNCLAEYNNTKILSCLFYANIFLFMFVQCYICTHPIYALADAFE